ncbi:MAG: hypothetical protein O2788_05700 [Chloroflexi bacterium]|nr:hypothetical protein [Chloroflexota bacterium]
MSKVEEPKNKWKNEIEEILEHEERRKPELVRISRPVKPRKVRTRTPAWYPTPEKLIVGGMLILIAGVIFRNFVLPLTITGFVLSGIGYYLLIRRNRRMSSGYGSNRSTGQPKQYWRGKPVDSDRPAVKRRDGNILEFPATSRKKTRRWFGRK